MQLDAICLGEGEVDGNYFGRRAIEEVDQQRNRCPRPRPAPERFIEVTDRRVVQFENDDVGMDVGRIGGDPRMRQS